MVDKKSYDYHVFENSVEKNIILADSELGSSTSLEFSCSSDVSKEIPPSMEKGPSRIRSALVMFSCFFLHMSTLGLVGAYGIIYVELIEVFRSSRAVAALVMSSFIGLSLASGLLFSRFIMKYDVGICVMIASTIGFFSMACASLSPNIGTVIVLMGVVPGFCASVNILSAYSLVSWFFLDNRKIALSVLTIGAALGQSFMPYLTSALIQEYKWNGCVLIMSALIVFNSVPCGFIILISKNYYQKPKVNDIKTPISSLRNILSDKVFMYYLFTLCLTILFGPVEQWFVADLAVVKGFGVDSGAVLLSLNGIFGLASRIVISVMFKIYPNTRAEIHIIYAFVLWSITHIAVVSSPVFWGMVLSMIVRGYAVGVLFACIPSLQLEIRGVNVFSQTTAISNLVNGVCNVFGGMFGGYVTDISGSYNLIFYIAAAAGAICSVNMVIINVALKRQKRSKGYEQLQ